MLASEGNADDSFYSPVRRSPRIVTATTAISGRVLNCSIAAAKDFSSPFVKKSQNAVAPAPIKRKSDTVHTPVRNTKEKLVTRTNVLEDHDKFDFCGIPIEVQEKYKLKKKINKLYEWQEKCLSDYRLLRGSNVIVSLPTGAGKTLIAEILMLREATVRQKSSILVLPYVAIVQEKISTLSFFEEDFGIHIEEYASSKGRIPPIKRRKGVSIYIATIEKANMLINSLIEQNQLDQIGLLVVDELHMLGDGSRGATLEQLLSKYLYRGIGQIVGISATLSNMSQLEKFLKAYVFSTSFRPVKLNEFMVIGRTMHRVMPGGRTVVQRDFPEDAPNISKMDPDGVTRLLRRVIPLKSALIFCPTKKNCETLAILIAKVFSSSVSTWRERKLEEKKKLIKAIIEENDGHIDEGMKSALLAGIGYHHSGLTHGERKHIEEAYYEGTLCVICATSTLAAGVNLPARVVIIKAPFVGPEFLKKSQYLQMIGRAGRAGFDDEGDSITIVRPGPDERKFREMLLSDIPMCESSLSDPSSLASFVLDIISLKIASDSVQIMNFLSDSTLLFNQKGFTEGKELVNTALESLKVKELIIEKEEKFEVSELGLSAFKANFEPEEVGVIKRHLTDSLHMGLIFSSHFHLLFLISPYDVECAIDWDLFHKEYKALSASEKILLASTGLKESDILKRIQRKEKMKAGEPPMRLYLALILHRIWNQQSPWRVAEDFRVERGWLHSVLQSSICQAAAITKFSETQEKLWPLRILLPELVKTLSNCVHAELVPLMSIDGIKSARARQLYAAGFKTVKSVMKKKLKGVTIRTRLGC